MDNKINSLKTRVHPKRVHKTLSDIDVINHLKELQEKYVILLRIKIILKVKTINKYEHIQKYISS